MQLHSPWSSPSHSQPPPPSLCEHNHRKRAVGLTVAVPDIECNLLSHNDAGRRIRSTEHHTYEAGRGVEPPARRNLANPENLQQHPHRHSMYHHRDLANKESICAPNPSDRSRLRYNIESSRRPGLSPLQCVAVTPCLRSRASQSSGVGVHRSRMDLLPRRLESCRSALLAKVVRGARPCGVTLCVSAAAVVRGQLLGRRKSLSILLASVLKWVYKHFRKQCSLNRHRCSLPTCNLLLPVAFTDLLYPDW